MVVYYSTHSLIFQKELSTSSSSNEGHGSFVEWLIFSVISSSGIYSSASHCNIYSFTSSEERLVAKFSRGFDSEKNVQIKK